MPKFLPRGLRRSNRSSLVGCSAAVPCMGLTAPPASSAGFEVRTWTSPSAWLHGEGLGYRRKVSDVWFGGEKCVLHLSSALLVVSRIIFLLKAVGFIKDYYFRHPFPPLLKAH